MVHANIIRTKKLQCYWRSSFSGLGPCASYGPRWSPGTEQHILVQTLLWLLSTYSEYCKALIFCGLYISQILQISLHLRNLFSTKTVSTSHDPYIRTSSMQMALYKYFKSSQCTPKSKRSSLGSYAVGRFLQLFVKCRAWFNKTQDRTIVP